MKKKIGLIALLLLAALLFNACGGERKPEIEVLPDWDHNTVTITTEKAGVGSVLGGASITLHEGELLVVDSTLHEKSGIGIRFFRSAEDAGADAALADILHENDKPLLSLTLDGPGVTEYPLEAGEYSLVISVEAKSTGVVKLSVR